jgi:thymidylate synthase (FAD)
MSARLIAVSKPAAETGVETAEDLIAYVARVSNPSGQGGGNAERLLRYCIQHEHWSVFETASMTIEIETTRAIAAQLIRHRSFCIQEFSQRYAVADTDPEPQVARSQCPTNRQASHDTLSDDIKEWWVEEQRRVFDEATGAYLAALDRGIAKECARFVLPLATPTRLYMTGSVRSWMHYIKVRTAPGTQPEHAAVAEAVKKVFVETFPTIGKFV